MRKLLLTATIVFALMAAIPAVSLGGKGSIGTEDTCAATLTIGVESASACGGQGTPLSPCTWVPYVGWVQWYFNGYTYTTKPCIPGNAGGVGG